MDSLRQTIETSITAFNSPLREAVKDMDLIILLRNTHPRDREDFVWALWRAGKLTREQAKEFINFRT